jgi:hypothetical protein
MPIPSHRLMPRLPVGFAVLAAFLLPPGHAADGGPYALDPQVVNQGGQPAAGGSYQLTVSAIGGVVGGGSASAYAAAYGYAGQLAAGADDPPTGPRIIRLVAGSFSAREDGGSLRIGLERSGSTADAILVPYTFSGGDARPGVDVAGPLSGTAVFAAGSASAVITLALLDDGVVDGERRIDLSLAKPAGARLGTPSQATIAIADAGTGPIQAPRPRVVSEPRLWAVAGEAWTSEVEIDVRGIQVDRAATPTYDLRFSLAGAPAGMTVVKQGPSRAVLRWTAAGATGSHVRPVLVVRDAAGGGSDRQEMLIQIVAAPPDGSG